MLAVEQSFLAGLFCPCVVNCREVSVLVVGETKGRSNVQDTQEQRLVDGGRRMNSTKDTAVLRSNAAHANRPARHTIHASRLLPACTHTTAMNTHMQTKQHDTRTPMQCHLSATRTENCCAGLFLTVLAAMDLLVLSSYLWSETLMRPTHRAPLHFA